MEASPPPRPPPPAGVALVARTHALVGATALVSVLLLHLLTRDLERVEFGPRTYAITFGFGLSYCLTGLLVWFGLPGGRFLSRLCGALYLVRPRLGFHLLQVMDSAEYQAHFTRRAT
jgi:hypothetical protein